MGTNEVRTDVAPSFRDPRLPVSRRVDDLVGRLTLEEKIDQLCADAPGIPRLGIPAYNWWNECLHGIFKNGPATVFPQAINLGATWDPELVRQVAGAIADEARAKYHHALATKGFTERFEGLTFYTPTVNLSRDPRWGRAVESYSEDPLLAARMAVAFVRGLQGDDPVYLKVAATAKHFVANNEEDRRLDGSATVDEASLEEYYFRPFAACVREARVASVMGAYNAVNGIPCCAHHGLLTGTLRDRWGFTGFVVSDGSAIPRLRSSHRHVATDPEASAAALNAGVDMAIRDHYRAYLRTAVDQGLAAEGRIDEALRRVLAVRVRLGMFDPPERVPYAAIPVDRIECAAHGALAREAARRSLVLLENRGALLPFDPAAIRTLAVIGVDADRIEFGAYSGRPSRAVGVLQGLRERLGPRVALIHAVDPVDAESEVIATRHLEREDATDGLNGVLGAYWQGRDMDGEPSWVRPEAAIDHDGDAETLPFDASRGYAVRWNGYLLPDETGTHRLEIEARDGARFFLDDACLFDTWGWPPQEGQPHLELEAGRRYPFRLEMCSPDGRGRARLRWTRPGVGGVTLPEDVARRADAAVVVLRDVAGHEGRDRGTIEPRPHLIDLARRVCAANPATVVVVSADTALALTELRKHAPALLLIFLPGQAEGEAVADVLLGACDPAGRLPVTIPSGDGDLPPMDSYDIRAGRSYRFAATRPAYPFGYGLSYTTFAYAGPSEVVVAEDRVELEVTVTNTGSRTGDDVVQLYVSALDRAGRPPLKELVDFRHVHLAPGVAVPVRLGFALAEIARYDASRRAPWVVPGDYRLQVGPHAQRAAITHTITAGAENRAENQPV